MEPGAELGPGEEGELDVPEGGDESRKRGAESLAVAEQASARSGKKGKVGDARRLGNDDLEKTGFERRAELLGLALPLLGPLDENLFAKECKSEGAKL